MNTKIRKKQVNGNPAGREGSALVIVMCFSAILLMTVLALHRMSTQLAFTVSNFRRGAQALAVAEAGVSDALKKLASDFETYKISTISNTCGNGSYVVNVTTNGKTGAIITSAGSYERVSRQTVLETLGVWQTGWNTNIFGEFGIFANGLVDGNGNGVLHAGIYSGTGIEIAPNCVIEKSVVTVGEVDNKGAVEGSITEHSAPIECPTFSFDYYKNLALNNGGDYYSGDKSFMNQTVDPPSGVTCVDGDVKIQNGAIIKGAIVARGDIIMTGGQIDHIALTGPGGETLPSLMSITGDVKVNGGQTLNGFIYAAGNVEINGGDRVYGGIIAGGIVDARGNWEVFPGDGTIPPGLNPTDEGEVVGIRIGAWLR